MTVRWGKARALLVCAVLALFCATSAYAQIRANERAQVAQTVDGTTITVDYSRPLARGRTLFGGLVAWDVPWTGANWATTLDANHAIRLNGVDVPAARYSVWFIPRETGPWTVSLDRHAKIWHLSKPDSSDKQIHIAALP